jgi:hypothetical protein
METHERILDQTSIFIDWWNIKVWPIILSVVGLWIGGTFRISEDVRCAHVGMK